MKTPFRLTNNTDPPLRLGNFTITKLGNRYETPLSDFIGHSCFHIFFHRDGHSHIKVPKLNVHEDLYMP
jgi:hypothetical protein